MYYILQVNRMVYDQDFETESYYRQVLSEFKVTPRSFSFGDFLYFFFISLEGYEEILSWLNQQERIIHDSKGRPNWSLICKKYTTIGGKKLLRKILPLVPELRKVAKNSSFEKSGENAGILRRIENTFEDLEEIGVFLFEEYPRTSKIVLILGFVFLFFAIMAIVSRFLFMPFPLMK